jgi:hypothetical protein
MVRVPQVDLPSVSVNAGAMPQFQAGQVVPAQNLAGQGAAQLGQGLEQAGAGMLRVQDRINDSRARSADTEFSEFSRAAVSDYRNKKGYDAIQARTQLMQDIQRKQKELADGLDNQWQREAFEQRAGFRNMHFSAQVDDHFVGQSTAYDIGQSKAALDANVSDYTDSFSSSGTIQTMEESPFYKDAMRNVASIMQAQGVQPGSPMWKQAEKSVETQMHVNTLASLAQSQDPASRQMARDYYKQHGSSIPAAERGKIDKAIRSMNVDDIAFSSSQQLMTAFPKDLMTQIETLDNLRAFGGIDEEEYKATLGKITERFNLNRYAEDQQKGELRRQYEDSLRGAISSSQDWSAWETSNAALVTQLQDLGMYDEAQSFWSNRGRLTTRQGEARMMEYLASPQMLKAEDGDVAKKWLEVSAQLSPNLSAQDLQKVEASFIQANGIDPRGQSPSGRGRAGDVVKIVSDEAYFNNLIGKLVGEPYDPAWEKKDKNPGNPAKMDFWLRAQLKLESELTAAGIDKNDRKAITDYVNAQTASTGVTVSLASRNMEGKLVNSWLAPLVYEVQTPEERGVTKWEQPVGSTGRSVTLTLGEWTGDPAKRAEIISTAEKSLAKYREAYRQSPSPEMQEKIDTIDRALKDSNLSGEDATRMGGGADTLIREYLRISAIDSENTFKQNEMRKKLDAASDILMSDQSKKADVASVLQSYMPPIFMREEDAISASPYFVDRAIADGVFGPADQFDNTDVGASRKKAAAKIVLQNLGDAVTRHRTTMKLQERSGRGRMQGPERGPATSGPTATKETADWLASKPYWVASYASSSDLLSDRAQVLSNDFAAKLLEKAQEEGILPYGVVQGIVSGFNDEYSNVKAAIEEAAKEAYEALESAGFAQKATQKVPSRPTTSVPLVAVPSSAEAFASYMQELSDEASQMVEGSQWPSVQSRENDTAQRGLLQKYWAEEQARMQSARRARIESTVARIKGPLEEQRKSQDFVATAKRNVERSLALQSAMKQAENWFNIQEDQALDVMVSRIRK